MSSLFPALPVPALPRLAHKRSFVRLHGTRAKESLESGKVACIAQVQVGRRTAATSPTTATTTTPPAATTTTATEATCSQKQITKSPSTAKLNALQTQCPGQFANANHVPSTAHKCKPQVYAVNHKNMQRALANSAGKTFSLHGGVHTKRGAALSSCFEAAHGSIWGGC